MCNPGPTVFFPLSIFIIGEGKNGSNIFCDTFFIDNKRIFLNRDLVGRYLRAFDRWQIIRRRNLFLSEDDDDEDGGGVDEEEDVDERQAEQIFQKLVEKNTAVSKPRSVSICRSNQTAVP